MQIYQVYYCSVDCSNALTSCQNALSSGLASANEALRLAISNYFWPVGQKATRTVFGTDQMQQDHMLYVASSSARVNIP